MRKRQTAFFGRVIRSGVLENIVTAERAWVEREMMLRGIRSWCGRISWIELNQNTGDRGPEGR